MPSRRRTRPSSEGQGETALERSGYPSLDPTIPLFTADSLGHGQGGLSLQPPRFVALAPKVYVARGLIFADLAFVLTDDAS